MPHSIDEDPTERTQRAEAREIKLIQRPDTAANDGATDDDGKRWISHGPARNITAHYGCVTIHDSEASLLRPSGGPSARQLPPFFVPCGTKDPLLDDSRRLGRALQALGVRADVKIYPGEVHAFHAFMWRPNAKACWKDTHVFLEDVLARDSHGK